MPHLPNHREAQFHSVSVEQVLAQVLAQANQLRRTLRRTRRTRLQFHSVFSIVYCHQPVQACVSYLLREEGLTMKEDCTLLDKCLRNAEIASPCVTICPKVQI